MKSVVPIVGIRRLVSFKMKVFFAIAVCLGIIFISTVTVTSGNPPGARLDGEVEVSQGQVGYNNHVGVGHDVADLKTLKLAQVIFRHGDRTPIDRYPKDPYDSRQYWPEGWGKLTRRGRLMQFRLGQYIRQRYDGYLSKTYTADEIYAQSSDVDRTIMSATANLAGMWPPTPTDEVELPEGGRQQYVPVHSLSREIDNKIGFSMTCPKYTKQFTEVVNLPSEKSYNLDHAKLYRELSEHTGLDIINYFNVSDIHDILFVQKSHNLTLPAWTKNYFPDVMYQMVKHWIKAYTLNDNMRILKASPLITEMVRNMKRVIGNPSEEEKIVLEKLFHTPYAKFYMYSGHDTTLSGILDALGLFDGEVPPYATSLYLELHQNESNEYYVKIFYRKGTEKSAEELKLNNCKSQPCRFNDFMEMMHSYILDENQWKQQCSI